MARTLGSVARRFLSALEAGAAQEDQPEITWWSVAAVALVWGAFAAVILFWPGGM